jgi:DNA-directed RNA polymerase subunit RPC12/RpoP
MKIVITEYHCDRCRDEIAPGQGMTDWKGSHYGLCQACGETHYVKVAHRPGGGEYLSIRSYEDDERDEAEAWALKNTNY